MALNRTEIHNLVKSVIEKGARQLSAESGLKIEDARRLLGNAAFKEVYKKTNGLKT